MASDNGQPAVAPDPVQNRSIPLVALRRPTPDSSSSTPFNSSDPTTSPETPTSASSPIADDTSLSPSHRRFPRQTTHSSGSSAAPEDSPFTSPIPQLQLSSASSTTIPQSVPEHPQPPAPPQRREAWRLILAPWNSRQTWVQTSIGLAGLVVALVGLFVYALRGYEVAKWTAYNDLLQSCAALVQAQIDGGPRCEKVLHDGRRERPYEKRNIPAYVRDRGHGLRGQIIGWSDGIFKVPPGYNATGFRPGRCTWLGMTLQCATDSRYLPSTWISWDSAGALASLSCLIISLVVLFVTIRRISRPKRGLQNLRELDECDNPIRHIPDDTLIECKMGGPATVTMDVLERGARHARIEHHDDVIRTPNGGLPGRLRRRGKNGTMTTTEFTSRVS